MNKYPKKKNLEIEKLELPAAGEMMTIKGLVLQLTRASRQHLIQYNYN